MKEIYILADSFNREICITKYDTYEEAFDAMKTELDNVLGHDSISPYCEDEYVYDRGSDYDIDDWSAWSNVGDEQSDWVIEKFCI